MPFRPNLSLIKIELQVRNFFKQLEKNEIGPGFSLSISFNIPLPTDMDDDQTVLFNFYQSVLVFIQMTLEFKKLSVNQTQQSILIFLDKLTEAHTQIVLNLEVFIHS
jgi:hypothetical protein